MEDTCLYEKCSYFDPYLGCTCYLDDLARECSVYYNPFLYGELAVWINHRSEDFDYLFGKTIHPVYRGSDNSLLVSFNILYDVVKS